MKSTRRSIAGLFMLALAAAPATAWAADLSDYVGEWRGTGSFARETPNEKRDGRLTCKLVIKASSATVIVIDGRCAAPEGSRGFSTRVTDRGGGRLSGEELKGTGARRGRKSSGTLGGSGLRLDGSDSFGTFRFALSAPKQGRTEMRSSATEDGKSESAQVVLKRK